tara:strand:- start:1283 stop:1516 length:234 start_codon:yes stop_codon:yes gene_type:complete
VTIQNFFILLTAAFIAYEIDLEKPKPYPIGGGDTLMVRKLGYEFCPKYCDVDHFHVGHFKNYNCEEDTCTHITINQD